MPPQTSPSRTLTPHSTLHLYQAPAFTTPISLFRFTPTTRNTLSTTTSPHTTQRFKPRRIHRIPKCCTTNHDNPENKPAESGEPSPTSATRQINRAQTKKRLLKILNALINLDSQRSKIEELILDLESLKATPATEAFTELALAGDWILLFSSMHTRTQGNVRLREIGQTFDIEKKKLVNRVIWTYVSRDGAHQIYANLIVTCSYRFVAPGRLHVDLEGHNVKVLEDGPFENKMPSSEEMQAVIKELQLALPIDFFDPSGLIDATYLEPSFRIAKYIGKRIAGVRNVFVKREKDVEAT